MSYYANANPSNTIITSPIGITTQRLELSADDTTSSGTYVDSSLVITLANRTGGKFVSIVSGTVANGDVAFQMMQDGVVVGAVTDLLQALNLSGGAWHPFGISIVGDLDGTIVKMQWHHHATAGTIYGTGDALSAIEIMEIGG